MASQTPEQGSAAPRTTTRPVGKSSLPPGRAGGGGRRSPAEPVKTAGPPSLLSRCGKRGCLVGPVPPYLSQPPPGFPSRKINSWILKHFRKS
ncbi:hypothetical protein E2C01_064403 [Portunus trituberculatus]|uniref:Uncharacterized protein n=1 Tax=Portunus trituberculatus TaxID=210409 RepID=A0A5B7HG39_PORTR|nr:hypothetical protein [Portunus trituberculatus]